MSVDLSQILVVGVSTRALFNLEVENEIFQNQGIEAFRKYQLEKEDDKYRTVIRHVKRHSCIFLFFQEGWEC